MPLTPAQTPNAALVAAQIGTVASPDLLAACLEDATEYVAGMVDRIAAAITAGHRPATFSPPDALVRRAVLETTADLYGRKSAPNGVRQVAGADGITAVRITRDPAAAARAVLADFLPVSLA